MSYVIYKLLSKLILYYVDYYCNNCDRHGPKHEYYILPSTAKEHADSAHSQSTPGYRDRFHFGKVSRGDVQKTRFSLGLGMFFRWTEY